MFLSTCIYSEVLFIFYFYVEIVGLCVIKYLNNSLEKCVSIGYPEYKR